MDLTNTVGKGMMTFGFFIIIVILWMVGMYFSWMTMSSDDAFSSKPNRNQNICRLITMFLAVIYYFVITKGYK